MNTLTRSTAKAAKFLPLLTALALSWPVVASAQGAKSLEGTWDIEVTLRDCATGGAIRSIPRLATFHKGGTLSEFTAAGTQAMPVARSPGHGEWEYLGNASFTYSVKFMRLTASGGPDGHIAETRVLEVAPSGDGFTADGFAVITLANGVQIPACATEVGTRLY